MKRIYFPFVRKVSEAETVLFAKLLDALDYLQIPNYEKIPGTNLPLHVLNQLHLTQDVCLKTFSETNPGDESITREERLNPFRYRRDSFKTRC